MGINVSLDILPDQIDDQSWEAVFDEAIQLAKAYPKPLMRFTHQEMHGAQRSVLSREIVDERKGTISICGDFETRKRAESFVIPRQKPRGDKYAQREPFRGDIVLADRRTHWWRVFHEKTQGYPYHIAILALGSLYESRFPGAALVAGDIDWEDCQRAVEWANSVLETPISIPVLVDGERLMQRLAPYCDSDALAEQFTDLFCGSRKERRRLLISYQPDRNPVVMLAKELREDNGFTLGALVTLRSWLDATHNMEGLIQACCTHEQGPRWDVAEVIDTLGRLWILNPAEETEALMDFIQQDGIVTLPMVNLFAGLYPEMNPARSDEWYRPGIQRVIQAVTVVTRRPRAEIEAIVVKAYQKQAEQIRQMKQRATEEVERVQQEEDEFSEFHVSFEEFRIGWQAKLDRFKRFLQEEGIPLTPDHLLPMIGRLAERHQVVLTEDAWSQIDNETDVDVLLVVAHLCAISEWTETVVKGREIAIESGVYREWVASPAA